MDNTPRLKGLYVIVVTPFDEQGAIDEPSLRAVVDFCLAARVDGLVTPANASEWHTMSEAERLRVGRIVVEQARRRAPVVLSITSPSQWAVRDMARSAQDLGADALMAMPPAGFGSDSEGVFAYYQALSQVARVPVIIQNCHPPLGTPMAPALLARLVDELPHIDYIKEEAEPCTHMMTRTMGLIRNQAKLQGIFGGQAGRYLLNELARGLCGTMPACDIPDAHAALWRAWEARDLPQTRRLYNRILPLLTMESLYGTTLYKEILRRRGALRCAKVRNPSSPLDDTDHRELTALLEEIADLLTVKGPFTGGARP